MEKCPVLSADDFLRIEDVLRVERLFNLFENSIDLRAEGPLQKRRPDKTIAVFCRKNAVERNNQIEDLLCCTFDFFSSRFGRNLCDGRTMDVPHAGMAVDSERDGMCIENLF